MGAIYRFPKNSLNFYEKRTFSEKGRHFCEFCEKDARFPRVEFVFGEKTNFCEFCEKDARLPRVELVAFRTSGNNLSLRTLAICRYSPLFAAILSQKRLP